MINTLFMQGKLLHPPAVIQDPQIKKLVLSFILSGGNARQGLLTMECIVRGSLAASLSKKRTFCKGAHVIVEGVLAQKPLHNGSQQDQAYYCVVRNVHSAMYQNPTPAEEPSEIQPLQQEPEQQQEKSPEALPEEPTETQSVSQEEHLPPGDLSDYSDYID